VKFFEVLLAAERRGGGIPDLSTGAPLLLEEVSRELLDELKRLSRRPAVGAELGVYADLDGLPRLREAFAARCSRDFARPVKLDEVLVTPGAQAALRYVHELVREGGRRTLYPATFEFSGAFDPFAAHAPVAGSYRPVSAGGACFRPTLDATSLDWREVGTVVLSRPHSPTGCLWRRDEIESLASAAARQGAWLVLDEAYGLPFAPLAPDPGIAIDAPNIVHLYSFSKVGLAGERVGVVVAPAEVVAALRPILRRNHVQSSKLGQHLALAMIELFEKRPDLARHFATLYRRRWERCVAILRDAGVPPRIRIAAWEGGLFLWCEWPGPPASDAVFSRLLQSGVVVAPGSAFRPDQGGDGAGLAGIRIGLGAPEKDLYAGLEIVARLLSDIG
jgi:valine--pyruvate aminotransferase